MGHYRMDPGSLKEKSGFWGPCDVRERERDRDVFKGEIRDVTMDEEVKLPSLV